MQKRSNLDLWNEYANARKINNKGNCDAEKISDLQKPEYTLECQEKQCGYSLVRSDHTQ